MEAIIEYLAVGAVIASLIVVVFASTAVIVLRELRHQRYVRSTYAARLAEYRRAVTLAADSR